MGGGNKAPRGGTDNRSQALGNRSARAPIDNYRKKLGSREVHSVGNKKERAALVRGADGQLTRQSNLQFWTSTPFLLFMLILVLGIVTYLFWSLAQTPIEQMNQVPKDFVKRTAAEGIPHAYKQALRGV